MSKIPCNEPRCPNNFHYSQTDLETIHKSMGISTRGGNINNNVINNTDNSFYSQDVESFSREDSEDVVEDMFDKHSKKVEIRETSFSMHGESIKGVSLSVKDVRDNFNTVTDVVDYNENDKIREDYEIVKSFENNVESFDPTDYRHNYYSDDEKYRMDKNKDGGGSSLSFYRSNGYLYSPGGGGEETFIDDLKVENFLIQNNDGKKAQVSLLTHDSSNSFDSDDDYLDDDGDYYSSGSYSQNSRCLGMVMSHEKGAVFVIPFDNIDDAKKNIAGYLHDFQDGKIAKRNRTKPHHSGPSNDNPTVVQNINPKNINITQEDNTTNITNQNNNVINNTNSIPTNMEMNRNTTNNKGIRRRLFSIFNR